jgi:hypothetical protein
MTLIDRINAMYGRDTVRCGIFLTEGLWRTRSQSARHVSALSLAPLRFERSLRVDAHDFR